MSRFEELCKTLAEARKTYLRWRSDYVDFGENLLRSFVDYLGCPPEQVRYVPLRGRRDPKKIYQVHDALYVDEDSSWHLGVALRLHELPDKTGEETHILEFVIQKRDSRYLVRLHPHNKEFEIDPALDDAFDPLFDFVISQLKDYYEKGLQDFLEHGEIVRHIGFHHGDLP